MSMRAQASLVTFARTTSLGMKSETHEWVDTIINGIVAVGTLAAVV
jgi:hypothetical protein